MESRINPLVICLAALLMTLSGVASGQEESGSSAPAAHPNFAELKAAGALRSSYRNQQTSSPSVEVPEPQLELFRRDIEPILTKACIDCHGPDTQEGNVQIDALNPDLLNGDDTSWWMEVRAALSKGEMPPPGEGELDDVDRAKIVDWLSAELQTASIVQRARQDHSSFRRLTRYEFNYALQDLLGLPYDFAKDLPPEATSEDGFQNSSEMLGMSTIQFAYFRDLSRSALQRATVQGDRPAPIYWGVSMQAASAVEWANQEKQLNKVRKEHKDAPEKLQQEIERLKASFRSNPKDDHYKNLLTGETADINWSYPGAKYAWKPTATPLEIPAKSDVAAIIPMRQAMIVELGDTVPDDGILRVRVRATRTSSEANYTPSLRLEFGWQASNDSRASVQIGGGDIKIDALPDQPKFYQWEAPLSEVYPRNSVRHISKMGDLPSPSEYVRLVNTSVSPGDIQIDYVEIMAPVYEQWPPASHSLVFIESENKSDEPVYAREILARFMSRAWRRDVTAAEVDQKLALFTKIRPQCGDFQTAMIEVLATVLASPQFLYIVRSGQPPLVAETPQTEPLTDYSLATRLSMFLWCSTPDDQLLTLASHGELRDPAVLAEQVERMLKDPRSHRFSEHFVRQWLDMQLLNYLRVDKKAYPRFNADLKEAMQAEPVAFFVEVLRENHSVLDFIHADYTFVNERLAKHYGLKDVTGNEIRKVELQPQDRRGGLMTQAGLLAMNSDGKDSHPLKRGIWMLESLLNDPPPPPPAAVPQIDLADPEIAKLTLKQRIENHRNQAACNSCHSKIDPWGIAFENFDAIGSWRTEVQGEPVDASSVLFNNQRLDGVDGLKRYLLENRQDQFVRAMVHKLTTYALGRPLKFGDHASVDQITADVRKQGDGLATMITLIVTSDLFQENEMAASNQLEKEIR